LLFLEAVNENSEDVDHSGIVSPLLNISTSTETAPVKNLHNKGDFIAAV